MDQPICDVVLPCRDEAAALPIVLADVPQTMRPIVVDNGSSDATPQVADGLGATVVHEPQAGYGAAVHAGVTAASAEYVAVSDADGSMQLSDLAGMLTSVQHGHAEMAIGRRRPTTPQVWPWHARVGTVALAAGIRWTSGLAIHDLAPMRVCRRQELLDLGVEDRRFGYPLELMLRAGRAGWTVREFDIAYGWRAAGTTSKVSGSVRGTVRVIRDFARVLRRWIIYGRAGTPDCG